MLADIVNYSETRKTDKVYVDGDFVTEGSYNDIKNYYTNELINKGWAIDSENIVKYWGKDIGLKSLVFKKDEMELEIFYIPPNHQEEYSCSFAISIELGIP